MAIVQKNIIINKMFKSVSGVIHMILQQAKHLLKMVANSPTDQRLLDVLASK